MHGYQSGKLFAEIVKRAGGKTDEASIVGAIEGLSGFDTGLMAPLTFSPKQHAGALAGAIMKAQGGKWKIISDFYTADRKILDPMVKDASAKYGAEKKIEARDCATES